MLLPDSGWTPGIDGLLVLAAIPCICCAATHQFDEWRVTLRTYCLFLFSLVCLKVDCVVPRAAD
jgi:hypothetical protein